MCVGVRQGEGKRCGLEPSALIQVNIQAVRIDIDEVTRPSAIDVDEEHAMRIEITLDLRQRPGALIIKATVAEIGPDPHIFPGNLHAMQQSVSHDVSEGDEGSCV